MAADVLLEWDEEKRRTNRIKHGVDFSLMSQFEWASAIIIPDDRFDEERSVAIGMVQERLHVAAVSYRDDKVRIISFRNANKREQRRYENGKPYSRH